jgi:hypothetical protein
LVPRGCTALSPNFKRVSFLDAAAATDSSWERRPKVPMSKTTERRLASLAKQASAKGRKVTPMQLAARILEEALSDVPEE